MGSKKVSKAWHHNTMVQLAFAFCVFYQDYVVSLGQIGITGVERKIL
jgi:hypothetical protein